MVTYGLTLGYSCHITPQLLNSGVLGQDNAPWFITCLPLGAALGSPLAVIAITFLGQKFTFGFICVLFDIAGISLSLATNESVLLIGRFIGGVACGLATVTVPPYLSEMSVVGNNTRGVPSFITQVCIYIGLGVSYICGQYLHFRTLALVGIWPSVLPIVTLAGSALLESSYNNRECERRNSKAVKMFLRNSSLDTEDTCDDENDCMKMMSLMRIRNVDCYVKPRGYICLMILYQLLGVNILLFNMTEILTRCGAEMKLFTIVIFCVAQILGFTL